MATKSEQKFVVKSVRESNGKRFYSEVGRLTIRDTDKGVNGTLYLHMFEGSYAVFPADKADKAQKVEGAQE
jgi:hypothetical protein